jgi:type I restriction enzyme, S subunit
MSAGMNVSTRVSRGADDPAPAAELRRFKPYPAYKDSGVEWLGKIPAGWDVAPLFTLARERDVRNIRGRETNVLSLSYGRIVRRDVSDNFGLMPESFDTYQIVEPGNIALRLTDLQNDKRSLRVGLVNERGIITSAYVALEVRPGLGPGYAASLLHAYDTTKVFYTLGGGVRQTMKFDDLKRMLLLLPSDREQGDITAFLDRETARIDLLVEKNEQLIKLLEEKRTALITRTVTKGLAPNLPTKDSGVEWLGNVPVHWDVMALSQVTLSKCDGPFGSGLKSEHYSADGVRVVRLQNIGWTEFADTDRAYVHESHAAELGDHRVVAGDLLIAGLGDDAHPVGRACVAPEGVEPAMVKADCFRFRLDRRRLVSRFAAYQLSTTALAAAGSLAKGATRARMNLTATATRKVAVPPVSEQHVIADALDKEGESFRALIAKVGHAIDLLRELRISLVFAAVTGKIDVREEVA